MKTIAIILVLVALVGGYFFIRAKKKASTMSAQANALGEKAEAQKNMSEWDKFKQGWFGG